MNKKLIAIAIAGAMSAPFAANAGEASIYGVMDVSIDAIDNDDVGATGETSSTGVSSNSSLIGFKGSEDLGGGMKAVWQIESNVRVGQSGANDDFGGRNTFAGLAGGFGTVVLGKHDTPLKGVGRKADLFGNAVGDSRNMIAGGVGHIDMRPDNVIGYISPTMGGFHVFGAYVTDASGEQQQEDNDVDAYSVSLNYSAGPLYVGFATEGVAISDATAGNTDTAVYANAEDQTSNRLVATYKMGAFKVAGLWQDVSDADGHDGKDQTVWGLGGAYTMGNNTIKAQYYVADEFDDWNDRTSGAAMAGDDTGGDMWAIGLDHAMSKQTKLYAVYAAADNDDETSSYGLGGGGHGDSGPAGMVDGADASAFSVGMKHKF